MVRDPGLVGLDLKSLMAANYVAKQRMLKLFADYGHDTVDTVSRALIDAVGPADAAAPVWKSRTGRGGRGSTTSIPSKIMRIELVATKEGDTLTFDFSGAPEQVSSGVNCSYWATWGSVFGSLLPMLAHDMVWNDGIFKCIKLIAPEGTVVNARAAGAGVAGNDRRRADRPQPGAHRDLQDARRLRETSAAGHRPLAADHHDLPSCPEERSVASISAIMAPTHSPVRRVRATFRDGVDIGGMLHAPVARCANVERHEMSFPHRYLYRRVVPDSGGPGKFRGGVSHEYAIVPHRSAGNNFTAVLMPGRGAEALNSQGTFGGYPGCNTACIQFRNATSKDPRTTSPRRTRSARSVPDWASPRSMPTTSNTFDMTARAATAIRSIAIPTSC